MNRRFKIYLIGVFVGCLILLVLPKPFQRRTSEDGGSWKTAPGLFPIELVDSHGRTVSIHRVPRRIISLAPSITETIYALGAESRLAATTRFCTFPEEARNTVKIGDLRHPNIEVMLQLGADLVIGSSLTSPNVYDRMGNYGLPAVALQHSDFSSVLSDIRTIGKLINEPRSAIRLIDQITKKRKEIEELLMGRQETRRRTVLLYDLNALHSAGGGSWAGDLLEICHAENVARSAGSSWPQLSREGLVALNPEVILVAVVRGSEAEEKTRARISELPIDAVWKHISAVRENRIFILDRGPLEIPGPRVIEAMEAIARAVYPEAFEPHDTPETEGKSAGQPPPVPTDGSLPSDTLL